MLTDEELCKEILAKDVFQSPNDTLPEVNRSNYEQMVWIMNGDV